MKSIITVNERGTLTLPAKFRRQLGLGAEHVLLAELTPRGILLRPSSVVPFETYSKSRQAAFAVEESRVAKALARRTGRKR